MDDEDYFSSSDVETNAQLVSAVEQVGGGRGDHFRFVLDPIIERRSAALDVRERIFRTTRGQNINRALAQGLRGAIETLLDDAIIHARNRVFLRFHSPRHNTSFSRELRISRWRGDSDTVIAFLDDLAQKLNPGVE